MSDETNKIISDDDMCKCGKREKQELHTCPYSVDVNNDEETLCDCCDECTYQCAQDI